MKLISCRLVLKQYMRRLCQRVVYDESITRWHDSLIFSTWGGGSRKIFGRKFQHILLWINSFKKVLIDLRAFAFWRRLPTLLSNLTLLGTGCPSRINEFRTRISLGDAESRFRGFIIGDNRERFFREDAFELLTDFSGVL